MRPRRRYPPRSTSPFVVAVAVAVAVHVAVAVAVHVHVVRTSSVHVE